MTKFSKTFPPSLAELDAVTREALDLLPTALMRFADLFFRQVSLAGRTAGVLDGPVEPAISATSAFPSATTINQKPSPYAIRLVYSIGADVKQSTLSHSHRRPSGLIVPENTAFMNFCTLSLSHSKQPYRG